jgi:hypothetical protein
MLQTMESFAPGARSRQAAEWLGKALARPSGPRAFAASTAIFAVAAAALLLPGRFYVASGLDAVLTFAEAGYRVASGDFSAAGGFGVAVAGAHALAFRATSDVILSVPVAHAVLATLVLMLAGAVAATRLPALLGLGLSLALSLTMLIPTMPQERFGAILLCLTSVLLVVRRSAPAPSDELVDGVLSFLLVGLAASTSLPYGLAAAGLVAARLILARRSPREWPRLHSPAATTFFGLTVAALGIGAAVTVGLHAVGALSAPPITGMPEAYRSLRVAGSGSVGAMEAALTGRLDGAGAFAAARLRAPTTEGTALADEEYAHILAGLATARELCGPDGSRVAVLDAPNVASSLFGQKLAGPASFAGIEARPLRGVGCLFDPKLPLRPAVHADIWTHYGDAIASEFRLAGETPYWRVLVEQSSPAALPTGPTGVGETAFLETRPDWAPHLTRALSMTGSSASPEGSAP